MGDTYFTKKKIQGVPPLRKFCDLYKLHNAKLVVVLQITQLMQIPPTVLRISEKCVSENHVICIMPLRGFPNM